MNTRKIRVDNEATIYLIAFAVTLLAILIIGGGFWAIGMIH